MEDKRKRMESYILRGIAAATLAAVCLCAGYFWGRALPGGVFTIEGDASGLIPSVHTPPAPSPPPPETGDETEVPAGPVNINTATVEALQTLPGIGPAIAGRIVDFREEYGPFISLQDLMNVSGIGERSIERLEGLVTW